jgi:hypothetical protein
MTNRTCSRSSEALLRGGSRTQRLASSQELIPEREAHVVDLARIRKRWRILDAQLQIVFAPIEQRDSSAEQEPDAAIIFVGVCVPVPETCSGFDVESVRQPPLQRRADNPGDLAVITDGRQLITRVRSRKPKHESQISRQETANAKIQARQADFRLSDSGVVLHAHASVHKGCKSSTFLRDAAATDEYHADSGENSSPQFLPSRAIDC